MTKEQAIAIAKEYKDNSAEVLVTSDGNVFFSEHKGAAQYHVKDKGLELFIFTKSDFEAMPILNDVETSEENKPKKTKK